MGSSNWNTDFYTDRVSARKATNTPAFKHDADVKTGKVKTALHASLDPKGVTRESRDSVEHPDSVAVIIMLDDTGSMARVPVEMQGKLPQLMGLLLRKGYVKDPQILFGAIGDYTSDKVALQVGQFESGIEMDDNITNLYLEGDGGGQHPPTESYQNALYFASAHTAIDCWEKRKHKGYLFMIGDERAYPSSTKEEIESIFGDNVQADLKTEVLVKSAQEKYNVFFIIPQGASHSNDASLRKYWADLLGEEYVINLDGSNSICESIGLAIGLIEGNVNPENAAKELETAGVSKAVAGTVATALDGLAKSTSLARSGTGNLPDRKKDSGATVRL